MLNCILVSLYSKGRNDLMVAYFPLIACTMILPAVQAALPGPSSTGEVETISFTYTAGGDHRAEARDNALAAVRREALAARRSHVESRQESRQELDVTEGVASEQSEYRSDLVVTARGTLASTPADDVHFGVGTDGRPTATVTITLLRERIHPGEKLNAIFLGPPPREFIDRVVTWRTSEFASFLGRAEAAEDLEALEFAYRRILREPIDPKGVQLTYVLALAHHYEDVGLPDRALRTLERWMPALSEPEQERVKRDVLRLRGIPVDGQAQLERLRRIVRGAHRDGDLRLGHNLRDGRATLHDIVTVRGTAPAGQDLHVIAIDSESIMMPTEPQWTGDDPRLQRVSPDNPAVRVSQSLEYHDPGHFIVGEARLIYLSVSPSSPPPPVLERTLDLRLCSGQSPDTDELRRLVTWVDALARWLRLPGNQGTEVSWSQVD